MKVFVLFFLMFLGSATPVLADSLTVSAQVEPVRAVFVDKQNKITKIAGNTTADIPPHIYNENSQPVATTPTVINQYEQIRKAYGKFSIGQTYLPLAPAANEGNALRYTVAILGSEAMIVGRALHHATLGFSRSGLRQMLRRRQE